MEREVDWTTRIIFTDPFFGLPTLPHASQSWPDKFSLKFKHPDTHETIRWQGEQYFHPLLLDVVDGVPYLVVYGRPDSRTEKVYGCPELPYIFLKYEKGFGGKWTPIPVEQAPDVLRESNLSPDYPDFPKYMDQLGKTIDQMKEGRSSRVLTRDQVLMNIKAEERSSGGQIQAKIPRDYDDWHTNFKNSERNERKVGDCRPPPKPLPDISLPKPVNIELEVVESKDYIVKSADEYYKSLWERRGTITRANCSKLFRLANLQNSMLGERFVNDPTGSRRLPYSGPTPFPSGRMLETRTKRYCNDQFVWFVAAHEELGKTIITKYTASGNLLYNVRMDDPKLADNGLHRDMVLDSMTVENGYFYFYWDQSLPVLENSPKEFPHRMTKFRFQEPVQEAASK